jgi:hypothetical protein
MCIGERECTFMLALRAQTCEQHYISSVGAQTAVLIETQIGTNTHWGNRHNLRVSAIASAHIHAHANVRAAPHIQHWRPNGWTNRDPNWYKHSLGQSAQFTPVGDRECVFMRAQRAQTQHYIVSVGAQTIETPIGTNTHWGNGYKLWESACAYGDLWRRSRPAQARRRRTSARREST